MRIIRLILGKLILFFTGALPLKNIKPDPRSNRDAGLLGNQNSESNRTLAF